jgi:hypothetical protein
LEQDGLSIRTIVNTYVIPLKVFFDGDAADARAPGHDLSTRRSMALDPGKDFNSMIIRTHTRMTRRAKLQSKRLCPVQMKAAPTGKVCGEKGYDENE